MTTIQVADDHAGAGTTPIEEDLTPEAPAGVAVPERRRGEEHRYLIAFAVVLAALMQVIDSSIVNVALPDMMGNLGASLDEIAWVTTGYILASVIVIPLTGWLGQLFGRKRYFVGSIALFTVSSFFCGASHSLGALIFWRIVQGIGGGALMTVSQAVLLESFPPEEAGTAMALFGVGVMVGPTIGPTLGGWLTDNYGWPWIFYINIPVGILAAVMIAAYVHDRADQKKPGAIDYVGIGLLAVSVGALQYLLEHGQRDDWFESRFITSLAVIGAISLIRLDAGLGIAVTAILLGAGGAALVSALRSGAQRWPIPWHAFGAVYIGLPVLALVLLRDAPRGAAIVGALFVAVWTTDTGALLFGRLIGGPKLAPGLSPNKTWAGFLGGTIAAAVAETIYTWVIGGSTLRAIMLGVLLALASHCGDLFESWVKRQFRAKNTGSLIPGHGGMLDRIDSVLFAAPACAGLLLFSELNPFGISS